jgi:hypothetical protein
MKYSINTISYLFTIHAIQTHVQKQVKQEQQEAYQHFYIIPAM